VPPTRSGFLAGRGQQEPERGRQSRRCRGGRHSTTRLPPLRGSAATRRDAAACVFTDVDANSPRSDAKKPSDLCSPPRAPSSMTSTLPPSQTRVCAPASPTPLFILLLGKASSTSHVDSAKKLRTYVRANESSARAAHCLVRGTVPRDETYLVCRQRRLSGLRSTPIESRKAPASVCTLHRHRSSRTRQPPPCLRQCHVSTQISS